MYFCRSQSAPAIADEVVPFQDNQERDASALFVKLKGAR
jgi:hypothetical protein